VPALAALCFLVWRAAWPGQIAREWPVALLFAVLTALALLFPLKLSPGYLLTLDTAANFAALLLFGPPAAMLVVGGGTAAANLVQALNGKRDGWNVAFNTGQTVLAVGVAGGVLYALRPIPAPFPLGGLTSALTIVLAAAVLYATTSVAVAVAVGLQRGKNPWAIAVRAWRTGLPDQAALLLAGLLTALLVQTHRWAAVIMVLLAAMVYASLQRTLGLLAREQAARAALERAVEARGEFLSVASHELRTPVASLRGYVQLLLRQCQRPGGPDPALLQRALRTIDQQSDKLTRLVLQLLDVSRLQAGSLMLDRQSTDLGHLAEEVVTTMQALTTVPLELRANGPVWAMVDPVRIEQVLVNLLDNAIRYGVDTGTVEVDVAQVADEEVCRPVAARLSVRDRGLSIPVEERQHVFERFLQPGGSRQVGGMGLGLYVSRQIIAAHGGTIVVETPDDGGNRFVVTLPAETCSASEEAAPQLAGEPADLDQRR
jgi:signal transduction histidine kinase